MSTAPGPYVGFGWSLLGGHLALDLINTVAWRPNPARTQDRLVDPAHLADWLAVAARHHGVDVGPGVTADHLLGSAGAPVLRRVRDLREAAAAAVAAHLDSRPVPAESLGVLRAADSKARNRAVVDPWLPLRPTVPLEAPENIVDFLALQVSDLCADADLTRLGRCGDADCGWFFLDTSRNSSRRWCDSGDCGNRARVRRFTRRHRADQDETIES